MSLRYYSTGMCSPVSLPASPTAYEARRLCPSSLVHPSFHAEYLLHHLEKPVTREVIRYVVCRIHQILSRTPIADFEQEHISVPQLETFASVLARSTFITLPTIICALLYLDRLELSLAQRPIYNHTPTSPHCILLSVLIVASKHQNDSSLTNAAWCDAVAWSIKRCKLGKSRSVDMLIKNVFSLTNIMAMERQCLDHLGFDLVVSEEEVELTVAAMSRFFASPVLPQTSRVPTHLEDEVESWLHGIPPDGFLAVTEDMSSQWFESPPSTQYLSTRRGSAPAILEHHNHPSICGAPSFYAAFPSDVSDGASSTPTTPLEAPAAELDFEFDELYEEVALDDAGCQFLADEVICGMEMPMMLRYPEPAMEEYELHLHTRGRSTHSKPLGDSEMAPFDLRPASSFGRPVPWVDHSDVPFILQH
ncbi:Cyclin, N-terminal domain [Ceratobasidium sp. AG-Ba]|nr:Cyclin, N-terminal domain [Ceratobasidium sp. AG-Ba]QRW01800.1 Cyclin, N-terminal domain [Ceratobasidium sp. AG-Ba]